MNTWETIVTSIGGSTVLCVVLGFLSKGWVESRFFATIKGEVESKFEKELEEHKAKLTGQVNANAAALKNGFDLQLLSLNSENSLVAERFKSELQTAASKSQSSFQVYSPIYAEVFAKMVSLRHSVERHYKLIENAPLEMVRGETESLVVKIQEAQLTVEMNGIYFSDELLNQLLKMTGNLKSTVHTQLLFVRAARDEDTSIDFIAKHMTQMADLGRKMNEAIESIRKEFRRKLEMDEQSKQP